MTHADKICASFADAVRDIPDGAVVGLAGFATAGMAINLVGALAAHGAKRLTLVANTARSGGMLPPGAPDISTLVERGLVAKLIATSTEAGSGTRQPLAFAEHYRQGLVDAELVPQGTLAERLRAAGVGIPAFYTPAGIDTELSRGKEERVFGGRRYVLEPALPLDYALLRAHRADASGNLLFRRAQRNFGPLMAMAARHVLVEVEEDILPSGTIDPDRVHTPGIFVHRMVRIPEDGWWPRPAARRPAASATTRGLGHQQMCDRLAQEFPDGGLVNLGIGIPTLCSNADLGGRIVLLHSENGIIGCGPLAEPGAEDLHLVNAGGQNITLAPGAAIVHHADSFALIRAGRLDVTVLGAFEVAANGDFANWKTAQQKGGRIGGAMDLAVGARRVFVAMEHTTRDGRPRLVERCALPVTGCGVVRLVMTNLGLFEVTPQGFLLREIAPGVTVDEICAASGCAIAVADNLPIVRSLAS